MKKVLVAVDGSEHGWKAIQTVKELAACKALDITVIHITADQYRSYVTDPVTEAELLAMSKQRAATILTGAEEIFGEVPIETLQGNGEPAAVIVDTAERGGFDTIVMGSRGMGRMAKLLMGSVSSKVVAHAHCSVLVVR